MKFQALILAFAMATTPAYSAWCNKGTEGDGGCEANGVHTYCVCLPLKFASSGQNMLFLGTKLIPA